MILTGLAVGIALGIVLQRGRFCVTGMLRDIFLQRSWRTFVALLVVISVHAIGIAALTSLGVIAPEAPNFAPVAVIVGAFVFGMGIILAGGCASGTWYRAAEGLTGSWIALAAYALSAAAMMTGPLSGFNAWMGSWETGLTTIPAAVGISPWFFALSLALVTFGLVRHFQRKAAALPKPAALSSRPWWKRPIPFYTAGALVGVIGVIAWPLSAATGRNSGLGITAPSADVAGFIVTGAGTHINWGTMLVLGLFAGAFVAAKASGEFRVRVPDATTLVRSGGGGTMMGVGAALAGGCTVGNGMVQTSLFSFQGWIALLFMALGVGFAARIWLKPKEAEATAKTTAPGTYTTAESLDNVQAPEAPKSPAAVGAPAAAGASASAGPSPTRTTAPGPNPFAAAVPGVVALAPSGAPSQKLRDLGEGYYALDSLGAVCPFPLIEAKDVMTTLNPGDHLVIDFDCTQATEAIPQWAAEDGHTVTDFTEKGEASWQITLEKA
ncbi:YeeE/YedE thiosulfate transporter family protein [Kocuria palustris]|uniref:YeeE/YedE thiosulfate transporter family protein n=1 Tax=Kocuria palustris TaxID=71999 RepID=UPI0011A97572|nr:YeeE/YedE thiosulfate transporter family protein [Kocuria palustris]